MTLQEALEAIRQGKRVRQPGQQDGSLYLEQGAAIWTLVNGVRQHQHIFFVTQAKVAEAIFTQEDEAATDWQVR